MVETLKIDLFAPGMSPLHRAGLGGLAATIRWLHESRKGKSLPPDERPHGKLSYDDRSVTLSWEEPERAGAFLRKLYSLAFQLDGGLIHLPGSYELDRGVEPWVKASLQQGMSQTILQFGPNRKAQGQAAPRSCEIDGKPILIAHQNLVGYTHQTAWKDLITSKGMLKSQVSIAGTIAPGFVQRHVAFPDTVIEQPPGHAIALHFALVGTFSLSIAGKSGVLVVPDVENLEDFAEDRGLLNPAEPKYCKISSAEDAALQAMVRIRGRSIGKKLNSQRILAILFESQSWNEKQKTRAAVVEIDLAERREATLDRFEIAVNHFKPHPAPSSKTTKNDGQPEYFLADSIVRPLVAENLARGRPWYQNFRRLIVAPDGKTDELRVRILRYEREGLATMIEYGWQDQGEKQIVDSIHNAMGWRFTAIKDETKYDPKTRANKDAYWNRRDRQMQRWRLAFAGAKTATDVRGALSDLWSRSGRNEILTKSWPDVLPIFCDDGKWELLRDLALLALSSYGNPKGDSKNEDSLTENPPAEPDQS